MLEFLELQITGSDVQAFLQGQLASDISLIVPHHARISARLDRSSRIKFQFIIAKKTNGFSIFAPIELLHLIKEELEKFVISEDVEFSISEIIYGLTKLDEQSILQASDIVTLGEDVYAIVAGNVGIGKQDWDTLNFTNDLNLNDHETLKNQLVIDSPLSTFSVSVTKGCYLGQEAASKLIVRGQKYYLPCYVLKQADGDLLAEKTNELKTFQYNGFAKFKLRDGQFEEMIDQFINQKNIKANKIDFTEEFEYKRQSKVLDDIFQNALETYHQNKFSDALKISNALIRFKLAPSDSFELSAHIYSLEEKYLQALEILDKLINREPNSVMAHTNKSIVFVKMGKIEEAENEKHLAQQLEMKKSGVNEEALQAEVLKEQERRIQMFSEVLEIDPEDEMALKGLWEIFDSRKQYRKAIEYVEKLVLLKPKSVDYKISCLQAYSLSGENDKFRQGLNDLKNNPDFMTNEKIQTFIKNYTHSIS